MMDEDFEWELSKENIRPLAQGRSVAQLSLALSKSREIEYQKRKFEIELRTQKGADLLDLWCRYIKWASQTCITGRVDFDLSEKCIKLFSKDKSYHDDARFVQICCRYAKRCEDRIGVFRIMNDMGIGCREGLFYKSWAECCEEFGKIKEADAVYERGLKLSTTNTKELKYHYRIFLEKLAATIKANMNEEADARADQIDRTALGVLSVSGKSKVAPVIRIPTKKTPGHLPSTMAQSSSTNQHFVFHEDLDENHLNQELEMLKQQHFMSSKAFLPENPNRSKENVRNPSKWSSCKVKQEISQTNDSLLKVYEDRAYVEEPKPSRVLSGSSILRTHHGTIKSLFTIEEEDNKEKYMCPLDAIYMGSEEFSLEELMVLDKKWRHRAINVGRIASPKETILPEGSSKTLEDDHHPLAGSSAQEFLQFWTEDNACDRVEENALNMEAKETVAAFDSETPDELENRSQFLEDSVNVEESSVLVSSAATDFLIYEDSESVVIRAKEAKAPKLRMRMEEY